jgi:hypothetical protein
MCSLFAPGRSSGPLRPGLIVLMSLPPAIPWRVALQHCLPPLHRLFSMLHPTAENSQAVLKQVREFFGRQKNISATTKKLLPETRSARYNNLCPGFGPLAGFEVIRSGRI